MKVLLTAWWQQVTGYRMAVSTAYSKGYNDGFLKGLAAGQRTARAMAFIDGFNEGRESTRDIPLDTGNVDTFEDDDDGGWTCSH
ncbi:MAG TPA: hypothetical protein VHP62_01865 [Usitatibacter sp.]|jgi:hypothetical protein|nr:hypothetical protein [Usitatibacter sp.]